MLLTEFTVVTHMIEQYFFQYPPLQESPTFPPLLIPFSCPELLLQGVGRGDG